MFANFANFFVESFVNTISYFIGGGVGPTLELETKVREDFTSTDESDN